MATRTDRAGTLRRAVRTAEGFLVAEGRATRTGVFVYRRADGSSVRELRPPEEVNDPASLETLAGKPIVIDHPVVDGKFAWVNPDNVQEFGVGSVGNEIRALGGFVSLTLGIQRADGIKAAETTHRELSNGYNAEVIDERSGVWNDSAQTYKLDAVHSPGSRASAPKGCRRFDAIQRQIRYNHVALVRKGRAGPDCIIRTDHADQIDDPADDAKPSTSQGTTMADITISDVTYKDVDPGLANAISGQTARHDAAIKTGADALTAMTAARDAAKALADQRMDSADRDKWVADRVKLVQLATPHMGDVRCDGLSDHKVRVTALKTLGHDVADKDDVYVTAFFDGVIANAGDRADSSGRVDADLDRLRKVAAEGTPDADEATKRADAAAIREDLRRNRYVPKEAV